LENLLLPSPTGVHITQNICKAEKELNMQILDEKCEDSDPGFIT
jgi:hypothetical protein